MPSEPPVDRRPLVERLRPDRLSGLLGNKDAVRRLRSWADAWEDPDGRPPRFRAALLEGPAGVGKTTAALALAHERGWTLVEMNASDARNQQAIGEVAGRAALTNTLGDGGVYRGRREGGRVLILLDEADCLTGRITDDSAPKPATTNFREFLRARYVSTDALAKAWGLGQAKAPAPFDSWEDVPATAGRGAWTKLSPAQRDILDWRSAGRPKDRSDRGGLGAIARLVKETRQPLILTVNDPRPLTRYSPVFRFGVSRIRFERVPDAELAPRIERIARSEGLSLSAATIDTIVRRAEGDVRAALTDLEAIAALPEAASRTFLTRRDREVDFEEFTREVFEHPRFYRNVEVRDRLDATPDDLFPWMEENLARYATSPRARYDAFEVAGRAELLLARARRARVFALWSFASELMTGGTAIAAAGDGPPRPGGAVFPGFLGEMGRTRGARAVRNALLGKAGARLHLSRRKGVDAVLPFLDGMLRGRSGRGDPAELGRIRRRLVKELGLSEEEVALLLGREIGDPDVVALLSPPEGASSPEPTAEPDDTSESAEDPPSTRAAKVDRRGIQRQLADY